MIDFLDEYQANKIIKDNKAKVIQEDVCGIKTWMLYWQHGFIDFQSSEEREARATAALFIYLYLECGNCSFSRDLACSYFDSRIGRKVEVDCFPEITPFCSCKSTCGGQGLEFIECPVHNKKD